MRRSAPPLTTRRECSRVDVAAGFFDGEIPHRKHCTLAIRLEERADVSSYLGSLSHQIEGEQQHRKGLEHEVEHRGAERDDVIGEAGRQIRCTTTFDELVADPLQIDVLVDVSLQPGLHVVDVARCLLDQAVDLSCERRADRSGETNRCDQQEEIDEPDTQPPPKTPRFEPVDRGFDGE